jgi:hypothetical protein
VLTQGIPVGVGRETGFGVIAGESTTDAAKPIVSLDYIELIMNRTISR